MREWLTVIIVLLIIGILLDGLRRMRQSRRESLRLSKKAILADSESGGINVSQAEFPSGGARVVGYRKQEDAESFNKNIKKTYVASKKTMGAPHKTPEQTSLNLEQSVPMLMDSVSLEEDENNSKDHNQNQEPKYTSNTDDHPEASNEGDHREPSLGSLDEIDAIEQADPESDQDRNQEPERGNFAAKLKDKVREFTALQLDFDAGEEEIHSHDKATNSQPEEVLIINILAKSGQKFSGENLLHALMDQNMKFGGMDIFHRHIENDEDGPIMFSLANIVVPGTFNLSTMNSFTTPGISMFLTLPVEADSIVAFDTMAKTAKALALELDGELKDENRSAMTLQTLEHCRQRAVEYERKRKLAEAH